ncbi:MAG: dihydroorotase [Longicatena sp.]
MKLIRQAKINQKDNDFVLKDVLFDETGIKKIEDHLYVDNVEEVINADGAYLLPGLIDVHAHLREPGYEYKETIRTGSAAAAHGGFTTIMAMPNVIPFPDNVDVMKTYLEKIRQDAIVNVIPYACITKGEKSKELSDIEGLSKQGIHAFSDDGVGVSTAELMEQALLTTKQFGGMIVAHTEDMKYRQPLACMHEGIRNKELGYLGIPSACEYEQLHRDLELVKSTQGCYHVCHMSAKESVELLKEYKAMGVNCSGEVTAHHLLLNEMDVSGVNYKMNPPLRSAQDQQALIQGLLSGSIDMIASDHAPHSEEEKNKGMETSPFGIVSLETSFPLLYTKFVKEEHIFTLERLLYWMSEAPATRFHLERKGKLAVGYDADMVLMDLDHERVIHKEDFYSKGWNTPFDGVRCFGWVEKTFVKGCNVYENKEEH